MKKVLFILAIVAMFTACTSGENSANVPTTDSTQVDTTVVTKDSTAVDTTDKK